MPLNKQSGNMYGFITDTWNPLGGECSHKCGYCSTHKLSKRYPVIKKKYSGPSKLVRSELKTNLKKDLNIFVVAQNDLFAHEIPDSGIKRVLLHCSMFDNKYFFQTKNPERYYQFLKFLPPKSTLCTTIETNRLYNPRIAPPMARAMAMQYIDMPKHVTIEPIMQFDLDEFVGLIRLCNPVQVNIGADSGNNNLPEPTKSEVLKLIAELEKFTTVHQKSNLNRLIK